jgi:hypothetical protein
MLENRQRGVQVGRVFASAPGNSHLFSTHHYQLLLPCNGIGCATFFLPPEFAIAVTGIRQPGSFRSASA